MILVLFFMFGFTTPIFGEMISEKRDQEESELKRSLTFPEQLSGLIESTTALVSDLKDVEFSIMNISLYQIGDEEEKAIPSYLWEKMGDKIIERILETKRFRVIECMECRVTQIQLEEDSFTILKTIESNARLKEMGENIGIDGFLFWDILNEEGELVLSLKLVEIATGRIVWSRQYGVSEVRHKEEEDRKRIIREVSFYTGVWGFTMERTKSNSTGKVKLDKMSVFGGKYTMVHKYILLSIGVDMFTNIVQQDNFSVAGFSVYPEFKFQITPLLIDDSEKKKNKTISNFNYYVALGEAFFNNHHSEIFKSGFEVRGGKIFIEAGVVYIPKVDIAYESRAGLENTGPFGGVTYDIHFGISL